MQINSKWAKTVQYSKENFQSQKANPKKNKQNNKYFLPIRKAKKWKQQNICKKNKSTNNKRNKIQFANSIFPQHK